MNDLVMPLIDEPCSESPHVPLSSVQQVIWFDQLLHPDVPNYQIGMCADIKGPVDVDALNQAVRHVAARHDALRMEVVVHNGEAMLRVRPYADIRVDLVDLSGQPHAREAAMRYVQAEFSRQRPLEGTLPWGNLLVQYGEDGFLWLHRYHHLIIDGYGVPMAGAAMVDAYNRLLQGESLDDPTAPSYLDFLRAESAYLGSPRHERDTAFWRARYATLPPALLQPRYEIPGTPMAGSGKHVWHMPRAVFDGVRAYVRQHGLTESHFFLALIHSYFSRVNDVEELVIGVPVHNRTTPAQRQTIGMFSSMNPVGVAVDTSRDFPAQMQAVARELKRCLRHQRLPISDINRVVQLTQTGRRQLYDITFSFEEFDADVQMGSGNPSFWTLHNEHEQTPLAIGVKNYHQAAGVQIELVYNRAYFNEADMLRLHQRLAVACDAVLQGHTGAISGLPIMAADEAFQLVHQFNATDCAFDEHLSLHQLFEQRAEAHATRTAVVDDRRSLTYGELNQEANSLARHMQALGLQANELVALAMARSADMVVALLAVLKCGAAYVPLDASHPAERLDALIKDLSPRLLLTQSTLRSGLPACACPVVDVETVLAAVMSDVQARGNAVPAGAPFSSRSLAYVIYTSGSTGKPKGVMNEHRGVVNRLQWMQKAYGLTPDDRVLQKTPYGFDVSVWEFFWPLITGAQLVMARPGGHQDPAYLADLIEAEGITTLHFVPSMLQAFLAHLAQQAPGRCAGIRRIICSGEELPWALTQQVFDKLPGVQLHNLYGPTEAAIDVTAWECLPEGKVMAEFGSLERVRRVPIGRPIDNTRIYILDKQGQPVPLDVPGEIHIGGVGVARGYLHQPALTAERFIPDPFAHSEPDARLYKTGDLGRWRADGAIEYLGRTDHQVKIRGLRIELGEIEYHLTRQPEVKEAVVLAVR
ncbi:MAG TPA: amino acid adenylation domain-containing protein, partial [Aquabacterium sp.]|uniref:non-ribosomal peptide synthetase n=1 Tax=Aquabacterium sp. TaxID=1872578 RepID=UPI002E33EF13